MNREVAIIVLCALLVLMGIGMWHGWRSKRQIDAGLPPLDTQRSAIGAEHFTVPMQYVATTHADNPIERVVARGLAMRGHGLVSLGEHGIWIERDGEVSFAIPYTSIVSTGLRDWAIDRAPGYNGLIGVDWGHGSTALTTFIRTDAAHDGVALLEQLPESIRPIETITTASKEQA